MRFVETFLHVQHGLTHLHLRHRADLLTIESGPPHDRVPHVRLRRTGPEQWQLEMATHTGRWQSTPMENSLDELLSMLVRDFGWVLASQA
jgi:hypothetical protein